MSHGDVVGYDVIGDVHGHHGALIRLLDALGYESIDGAYQHPTRRAVFVGDLIDRGSEQVPVVETVRAMVTAGSADIVLGNHEFNAVAFARGWRERSDKNLRQHAEFLNEVGGGSPLHHDIIDWFMTIPIWKELAIGAARLRVVHACWHEPSLELLRRNLTPELTLTEDVVREGSTSDKNPIYEAVEVVLKGPEVCMDGMAYRDKDGHERHHARVKWWNTRGRTVRELALVPSDVTNLDGSPFGPLPDVEADTKFVYLDEVPVVFGHYWGSGTPAVHSPTTATVDYSVAAGGQLVAYRWDGEAHLSSDRFVAVPGN